MMPDTTPKEYSSAITRLISERIASNNPGMNLGQMIEMFRDPAHIKSEIERAVGWLKPRIDFVLSAKDCPYDNEDQVAEEILRHLGEKNNG